LELSGFEQIGHVGFNNLLDQFDSQGVGEKKDLKIIKVNYFFDEIYGATNLKLELHSKLFLRYKPR